METAQGIVSLEELNVSGLSNLTDDTLSFKRLESQISSTGQYHLLTGNPLTSQ